jgi:carbon-monoxide dehydrogenase small subunit
MKLQLQVNGQVHDVDVSPYKRLLDVLREDLRLTGTKEGCGEGECGACTVMIDGDVVNSCLVAVAQAEGHVVTTVEGLADGALLSDVQEALVRFGGTQCGICTPGIALCAARVLATEPDAPRARLRELMSGNICRCTGYQLIVDALIDVARRRLGPANA